MKKPFKRFTLQTRLTITTMTIVAIIFTLCMFVIWIVDKGIFIKGLISEAQAILDQNAEVLNTMLLEEVPLDEVKKNVEEQWTDNYGEYFLAEADSLDYYTDFYEKEIKETMIVTSNIDYHGTKYVLGMAINFRPIYHHLRMYTLYMSIFAIFALVITYVSIRFTIRRLSRPEVKRQERLDTELSVASRIQGAILSDSDMAIPDCVDISAYMEPAKEIGGDLYNYVVINNMLHFIVADVSGKGIPAAIYMATTTKLYTAIAMFDLPPDVIASRLNETLCQNNTTAMFATAIIGRLNLSNGNLELCSAGHNYPLLLAKGKKPQLIEFSSDIPIGVVKDYQFTLYKTRINPSEHILCYTDGVTEAENSRKELFSDARLLNALDGNGDKNAQDIVKTLKFNIEHFTKGVEQSDDITILDICFISPKHASTEVRQNLGITLRPSLDELPQLFQIVEKKGYGDKIALALEEAFVNIVNYSGATNAFIEFLEENNVLTIEIYDDGKAFNPTLLPPPEDPDPAAGAIKIGGHGISLIRKIMDKVEYRRLDKRNLLILTKHL